MIKGLYNKKNDKKAASKQLDYTAELEKIKSSIMAALEDNKISYNSNLKKESDNLKLIEIPFVIEQVVLRTLLILQNGKVLINLMFPINVQCNTIAILALYIANYNECKAFGRISMDIAEGALTINYTYLLDRAEAFNANYFILYLMAIVKSAQEEYMRLNQLSMGKISNTIKPLYKALLEQSLSVLNGQDDLENVIYGCKELQRELSAR